VVINLKNNGPFIFVLGLINDFNPLFPFHDLGAGAGMYFGYSYSLTMSQPLEFSEDSFGCWDWLRKVEKNISLQDLCDFDDILNELKWGTEPKDQTKLDQFLNSLNTDELSGYIINKISKTHCGARACEVYFEKYRRDVRFNRDLLLFQVPKLLYHVSINMPRYTIH
jgi:hypothetical protein